MNTKLPTVAVGIAAYNEEHNIGNVIGDILKQNRDAWRLDKIYIACGGCTDNTVNVVKSMKSDRIKIFINPNREGKAADEQRIFDEFSSDYLVMFDADVRLQGINVINRLIKTFRGNSRIRLVGGNPRPYPPRTFFERAVYGTFGVLDKSRSAIGGGHNIYRCSGQCLAMTKNFAKSIRFPTGLIAEDDFIYFSCLRQNGLFRYCPAAVVMYNLPKKPGDYIRQVFRADPDAAGANVQKYFGPMVQEQYRRPYRFYVPAVLAVFIRNPAGSLLVIAIRLLSKPLVPFVSKQYRLDWYTAKSTK
jgi:glycosyltransferase involved in cell wall biosynthesis